MSGRAILGPGTLRVGRFIGRLGVVSLPAVEVGLDPAKVDFTAQPNASPPEMETRDEADAGRVSATLSTADNYGCRPSCTGRLYEQEPTFFGLMLISVHRQLRRHRLRAVGVLVGLGLAASALSVHAALMSSGMDRHGMSGAESACIAVGGCLAVAAVAVFAPRRLLARLGSIAAAPLAPRLAFVPSRSGFLVRAGPPPPLLSVFRL
jgi:hypothetical protein